MTVATHHDSPRGSMAVVHGIDALDGSHGRLFVVIGVFDGLHLGHAYLLDDLEREATERDARPAVITFDHHPDEILTGHAPSLLCDPHERLERLEAAGVAVTVVQTFDVALRETPFDAFVRRITDRVELAGFLMTPDSAFGYQRGGTPATVAALGLELDYKVVVVPPFTIDGQPVSSSKIRAAIAAGDLATAQRLLGRAYTVVGTLGSAGSGPDPVLSFAMPVALPPNGQYRVELAVDGAEPIPARGRVQDGSIRVDGPVGVPELGRAALTFRPG